MSEWTPIDGESPIDSTDFSDRTIMNRADAIRADFNSIRPAHVKYMVGELNNRIALFKRKWLFTLHDEMFGRGFSGRCNRAWRRSRRLNRGRNETGASSR